MLSRNKKYISNSTAFLNIPGSPIAYWASEAIIHAFSDNPIIDDIYETRNGMSTTNNNLFLRLWHECDEHRCLLGMCTPNTAKKSSKRWFRYNKGGEFRRWYGNNDYLVNWENDGQYKNPTINTGSGTVGKLPIRFVQSRVGEVYQLVSECIDCSRKDWDSFETSWDFSHHPICGGNNMGRLIADKYNDWEKECQKRFSILKANEEELNRIFIDIYDLQDELTPEVEDKDITVRLADKERDIKSLISYLVGIIMGRYSLDVDGLAYAGGDWDASKYRTYQPDDDGIIPIYSKVGMEDGLTARIIELVKLIYGEDTYRQNMDFIAEALGKGNNESSEETLNRYLNDGFYADHLKIYQKRPIYWMFSSGKNSGFKCLIYMHRYTEDTLARINGKYFLPESTRLKNDMEDLLTRINSAEGRDRVRLEKERQKLSAAYNEAIEYGQVLDHMANKYITIDLDDGVKTNYAKFQGVELVTDSGTKVKKDLLVPIK